MQTHLWERQIKIQHINGKTRYLPNYICLTSSSYIGLELSGDWACVLDNGLQLRQAVANLVSK